MYGGEELYIGFWWGNFRQSGNVEDAGTDRILSKWLLKKWYGRA
jgi:hypothetical protein